MGSNSTYFFAPPMEPVNKNVPENILQVVGHPRRMRMRRRSTARVVVLPTGGFDEFYPGYGVSWPTLTGAVGMTYEQASSAGGAIRRSDGTVLTLEQAIRQHTRRRGRRSGPPRSVARSGYATTSPSGARRSPRRSVRGCAPSSSRRTRRVVARRWPSSSRATGSRSSGSGRGRGPGRDAVRRGGAAPRSAPGGRVRHRPGPAGRAVGEGDPRAERRAGLGLHRRGARARRTGSATVSTT